MTDILTVTMNPALDVLTTIDQVSDTHKMRCGAVIKHPGGGGVNVARVLHRLGSNCVSLYLAGGVTGERHHKFMREEGVRCHVVPIAQETRESFSVHETSTGHDFRFVLPGPQVTPAELQACLEYIAQHMPKKLLVLSGGLAPGVPSDFFAQLVELAKNQGIRVALDSNGAALTYALSQGVYLFKPSLRELQELTGQVLSDQASQLAACQELIAKGQAEIIALSLGSEGALLVTAREAWRAPGLKLEVKTTIGAGDSFVAGMIWALQQPFSVEESFRYGMAAGAAALLGQGTALCTAADMMRLAADVSLLELAN